MLYLIKKIITIYQGVKCFYSPLNGFPLPLIPRQKPPWLRHYVLCIL